MSGSESNTANDVPSQKWSRSWLLVLAYTLYLVSFVLPLGVSRPFPYGWGAFLLVWAMFPLAIPLQMPNFFMLGSLLLFRSKTRKTAALILLPLGWVCLVISGLLGDMGRVGIGIGYYVWLLSQVLVVVACCDLVMFNLTTRVLSSGSVGRPGMLLGFGLVVSLVLIVPWCQRRARDAMVDAAFGDRIEIARIAFLFGGRADSRKKSLVQGGNDSPTAIQIAAEQGSDNVLRFLMMSEGDVDRVKAHGKSLLFSAVRSHDTSTVELLLELKADPQQTEGNGLTPLHIAAVQGDVAIMERLVAAGALVDAQASIGVTSLHYAASNGRADAVGFLLAHGADPLKKDHERRTPLDHARRKIETEEATAKSSEKAYDQAQVKRSLDHAKRCRDVALLLEKLTP